MTHPLFRLGAGALLGAAPLAALAHVGEAAHLHHGVMHGLAHPFTGLDHLAAMLAVGFWSALALRRPWLAPLAFALCLALGAALGLGGTALPGVEPMIAASLLVIGLLAAMQARWPTWAALALVGLFACFHGVAHGLELAGDGALGTVAGMLLGTVMLHAAGMAMGWAVRCRSPWWPRLAGGAVAAFGAVLLLPLTVLN